MKSSCWKGPLKAAAETPPFWFIRAADQRRSALHSHSSWTGLTGPIAMVRYTHCGSAALEHDQLHIVVRRPHHRRWRPFIASAPAILSDRSRHCSRLWWRRAGHVQTVHHGGKKVLGAARGRADRRRRRQPGRRRQPCREGCCTDTANVPMSLALHQPCRQGFTLNCRQGFTTDAVVRRCPVEVPHLILRSQA